MNRLQMAQIVRPSHSKRTFVENREEKETD